MVQLPCCRVAGVIGSRRFNDNCLLSSDLDLRAIIPDSILSHRRPLLDQLTCDMANVQSG